jgi:hypothetical protein
MNGEVTIRVWQLIAAGIGGVILIVLAMIAGTYLDTNPIKPGLQLNWGSVWWLIRKIFRFLVAGIIGSVLASVLMGNQPWMKTANIWSILTVIIWIAAVFYLIGKIKLPRRAPKVSEDTQPTVVQQTTTTTMAPAVTASVNPLPQAPDVVAQTVTTTTVEPISSGEVDDLLQA